jgi:hypothetical protein
MDALETGLYAVPELYPDSDSEDSPFEDDDEFEEDEEDEFTALGWPIDECA